MPPDITSRLLKSASGRAGSGATNLHQTRRYAGGEPITARLERNTLPQLSMADLLREAEADAGGRLPPDTKRGVTAPCEGNSGVHWVSLTSSDTNPDTLCRLLGLRREAAVDIDHGLAHYPRCLIFGSVRIGYGAEDRMGCHAVMPGKACEEFESREDFPGWANFAKKSLEAGCRVTRLDLYKDLVDGSITVSELHRKWRDGEVSSRAHALWPATPEKRGCGKTPEDECFYLGSRESESVLRPYDRAKKMNTEDGKPWLRIEIETKGKRAQALWQKIAADGFTPLFIGSVINAHTEFKETVAVGRHRCRAEVWGAWLAAMQTREKFRRVKQAVGFSLAEAEYRLEKMWGPAILVMIAARSGDLEWIRRLALRSQDRVRAKHWQALLELEQDRTQYWINSA